MLVLLSHFIKRYSARIIGVLVLSMTLFIAKGQTCLGGLYITPSTPLCYPQIVTVTVEYSQPEVLLDGEMRWYRSQNDPVAFRSIRLGGDGYLSDSYDFYANGGEEVWVSYIDYNQGCETPRVAYIANVVQTPEVYMTYARECGDRVAKIQFSSNTPGLVYQLYKYHYVDQWNSYYDQIGDNTTGYFEIPDFDRDEKDKYYFGWYWPNGCGVTTYYIPISWDLANPFPPIVSGNTTVCINTPIVLTASGDGPTFQWYTSSGGLLSQGNQFTIPASATAGSATYMVRGISSSGCITDPAIVNTTINPGPVDGTISASATTIHLDETATITSQGGAGSPYLWSNSNGAATWTDVNGAALMPGGYIFTPQALGTYRFVVHNQNSCGFCWDAGNCGPDSYVNIQVVDYQAPQIASVTPPTQLINYNGTAATLTVNGVTGGDNNYAYQWQRSPYSDFSTAYAIPGATAATYTPTNVTAKTWYRVVVTSHGLKGISPAVIVDVYAKFDPGTISPASITIPAGSKPGKLAAAPASGGTCNGSYTYQWQVSTDGLTFADLTSATDLTYEPGQLSANTYYRRKVTCGTDIAYTNSCQITIGTLVVENMNYIRTRTMQRAGVADEQTAANLTSPMEVQQTTQYFDGLAKLMQTVSKQASPDQKDVVAPTVFDNFNRDAVTYLPYVAEATDGQYKQNAFGDLNEFNKTQFSGESFFYGNKTFDASPLNKVVKTSAAGDSWTGSNRGIGVDYQVNATNEVRIWKIASAPLTYNNNDVTTNIPVTPDFYNPGTLYKNVTTDEAGNEVIEFKDKTGQVVLKKVEAGNVPVSRPGLPANLVLPNASNPSPVTGDFLATNDITLDQGFESGAPFSAAIANGTGINPAVNNLYTYYVYDNLNQLRFVIPPKAVSQLMGNGWQFTNDVINELCFRYEYDDQKRLVAKKVPGAEWVYMIYDMRDRLVFTQDGNMRKQAQPQWASILYDELNRPVITGLVNYTGLPDALQQYVNDNSVSASPVTIDGQAINQNPLPPNATFTVLTTTHYDDYNGLASAGFSTNALNNSGYSTYLDAAASEYPEQLTVSTAIKGLAAWTKTKVLNENKYITSCVLYDQKARSIQVQSLNYTGGMDVVTNQYSFSNRLLRTHLSHQNAASNPMQTYIVGTKNTYDHMGRVKEVAKGLNGSVWKKITTSEYNALGLLYKKFLAPEYDNNTGLESLTYDYNIRGWLLGANRNYATNPNSQNNYFGFDLGYDKKAIGSLGAYADAQYNGNITGTVWKSRGDGEIRKYDFTYDPVNRLTRADFNQYTGGFNRSAGVDFSVSNLTYDENGNILTQTQRGLKLSGSDYIDSLKYTYLPNSNKLQNVIDANNDVQTKLGDFRSSQRYMGELGAGGKTVQATDYEYDYNGNLKLDQNKDILSITYNHLNLPQTITLEANKGSIDYTYDALGTKIKKVVHETGLPDKTTLYQFGIYENDVLQFMPMEEGRIRPVRGANDTITSFTWDYFIKDHLGNVRMVLTEEQKQDIYPAATLEGDLANGTTAVYKEKDFYNINGSFIVDINTTPLPGLPVYQNNNGTYNPNPNSDVNANSQKLYKLNAATNKTGLGISLKVMVGDQIDIMGKSYWFNNGGNYNDQFPIPVDGIIDAFVGTPGMIGKGLTTSGLSPYLGGALNIFKTRTDAVDAPWAYINWIFFDEQFNYAGGGFRRISSSVGKTDHTLINQPDLIAPKNGYVFVYCSNESAYDVYFDNLQVFHNKSALLEETHYYPFGLTMAGISSKALGNTPANKHNYNGIEQTTELGLSQYDAFYRNLDPQIGRFWQIDPKPNLTMSLYSAMANNPILYSDPMGDTTWVYNQNGARLGVVPDRLPNQVHFKKTDGDPGKQFTTEGMSKKDIKKLGQEFREQSYAFIGSKTASDIRSIVSMSVSLKQEIGFVGTTRADKEIRLIALPVDGRNKLDGMPLESQINENYPTAEQQSNFILSGHTHMNAFVQGFGFDSNSASDNNIGNGTPTDPADYARNLYRSGNAKEKGLSPLLIGTPYGIVVYGTDLNANKVSNNSYILYKTLKE